MNAVYPDSTITIHGQSCFTDAPISSPSYIILKQILDMPFYLKKFQYVSLKCKDFFIVCENMLCSQFLWMKVQIKPTHCHWPLLSYGCLFFFPLPGVCWINHPLVFQNIFWTSGQYLRVRRFTLHWIYSLSWKIRSSDTGPEFSPVINGLQLALLLRLFALLPHGPELAPSPISTTCLGSVDIWVCLALVDASP